MQQRRMIVVSMILDFGFSIPTNGKSKMGQSVQERIRWPSQSKVAVQGYSPTPANSHQIMGQTAIILSSICLNALTVNGSQDPSSVEHK